MQAMDIWQRARSLASEAVQKSQSLTLEAVQKSQELSLPKLSDFVTETAKKSKELAAEASKRADFLKSEAFKQADKFKSQISDVAIPTPSLSSSVPDPSSSDLETFGVTDELRDFVKEINVDTFKGFPLEDDSEVSDVPTVSNVRQDLTEWQERHAKLVLATVKEISKLRYELCPRAMKERKFWRIYFILVNSHVAPYEKRYMEEMEKRTSEQVKDNEVKETPNPASTQTTQQSRSSTSANEQDLDVFLLGDLGDDDALGEVDDGFDDDFDKIGASSDDEKEK